MGESREDFILLQTIKSVEAGEVYAKIPPHATVLSWFTIRRALIKDLYPLLDELVVTYGDKASRGVGTERVWFGVNEDIPACEIDTGVQEIHDETMNWVDTHGGTYKFERFARELRSHVTDEAGVSVQPGDIVNFSSLALFSVRSIAGVKEKPVEYAALLTSMQEGGA